MEKATPAQTDLSHPNYRECFREDLRSAKRILIVGAGCSGLQCARVLRLAGFKTTILEESNELGGTWSNSHPEARLQIPYEYYEFPDFPWPKRLLPEDGSRYPTAAQVCKLRQLVMGLTAWAIHCTMQRHKAAWECLDA